MKSTAAPTTVVYDRDLLNDPVVTALLAHVPGVQVRVDDYCHDDAACATYGEEKQPRITLSVDLAHGSDRDKLYAALAHEVSHFLLGHIKEIRTPVVAVQEFMHRLPLVAAAALGMRNWVLAIVVMVVHVAFNLAVNLCGCRREIAADVHSVGLLNGVGLRGREMVIAVFSAKRESWAERWFGWTWDPHPSHVARVRAVRNAK